MNTIPHGIGPYPKPWPDDPRLDPELLEHGDTRNVLDHYRYWSIDSIRADLARSRSTLHVAIENWEHDMNIGTIVRTANAFNVAAVHIIGRRHWNKRGAMVTDRYIDVFHHATVEEFVTAMAGRVIIAVDNLPGSVALHSTVFPADCALVFGSEREGISDKLRSTSQSMVAIEQFGSTRSLNAGVAAGIVMHAWQQQHVLGK